MKYKYYAPHAKVVILNPVSTPSSSSDESKPLEGADELVSLMRGNGPDVPDKSCWVGLMLMEDGALHKCFTAYAHMKQDNDHQLFYYSNWALKASLQRALRGSLRR